MLRNPGGVGNSKRAGRWIPTPWKPGEMFRLSSSVVSCQSSVVCRVPFSVGQRKALVEAVSWGKEGNRTKGIGRSLNIFVSHLFLSRVPRKASKHLSIQPSSALLSLTGHFHLGNAPTSQSGRIDGLGGIMGRRGRGFVVLLALPPCCPPACDPCPSSSPTAPPPLPLPITSEGSARSSGVLQECCGRESELPHSGTCPAPELHLCMQLRLPSFAKATCCAFLYSGPPVPSSTTPSPTDRPTQLPATGRSDYTITATNEPSSS